MDDEARLAARQAHLERRALMMAILFHSRPWRARMLCAPQSLQYIIKPTCWDYLASATEIVPALSQHMSSASQLQTKLGGLLGAWGRRIHESRATPGSELDAYHQGMEICRTELEFILRDPR